MGDERRLTVGFRQDRVLGNHADVSIFMGYNPGARGRCGTVKMRVDEWEVLQRIVRQTPLGGFLDIVPALSGSAQPPDLQSALRSSRAPDGQPASGWTPHKRLIAAAEEAEDLLEAHVCKPDADDVGDRRRVAESLSGAIADALHALPAAQQQSADIDKLKSEQGANITYLRVVSDTVNQPWSPGLAEEIGRACDDIAAYREIVGLYLKGDEKTPDDKVRLQELVGAMTWGNP